MKKYISALVILPLLTACVDDKGSYDYHPVNEVSVDGIEDSYSVLAHIDRLQISPDLDGTLYGDNLDNYTYKWHVCNGSLADDPHHHIEIGYDKDLDWQADLDPGEYSVYFTVREKTTGLEQSFRTTLNVTSSFGKGFLILGDVDGTDRLGLDMLTMAPNRDTIMVEEAFDNSRLNLRNAKKLYYSGDFDSEPGRSLYVMTEDDSYLFYSGANENLFEPIHTFNDQGIFDCEYDISLPIHLVDAFPKGNNMYSCMSRNARLYVTEDVVFGGPYGYEGTQLFTTPYNRYDAGGSLFRIYPSIFFKSNELNYRNNIVCFMYDLDNECFVRFCADLTTAAPVSTEAITQSNTWPFNFKDSGYKFIYGKTGYDDSGHTNIVAIDNHGDYNVLRMVVPTTATAMCSDKDQFVVDLSIATDFDKASIYAFSDARTSVLYAVGKTLYHYDYSRKSVEKKEFDSEIIYLDSEYQSEKSVYDFILATWDDAAKGMIYKGDISNDPNSVAFDIKHSWPTRLYVKDISWFLTTK
ncbi:MAG: hypothetical protein HDS01_09215 [Bacteroides sp.]|nr:hypothetical protein [Bacteroides sp.]